MTPDYKAAWEELEDDVKAGLREAKVPPVNATYSIMMLAIGGLIDKIARRNSIPPKESKES